MRKILSITLISILCIATFATSCTKNKPEEEESTPVDQMILLQEGFDNGYPEGWEIVDADGDGIC